MINPWGPTGREWRSRWSLSARALKEGPTSHPRPTDLFARTTSRGIRTIPLIWLPSPTNQRKTSGVFTKKTICSPKWETRPTNSRWAARLNRLNRWKTTLKDMRPKKPGRRLKQRTRNWLHWKEIRQSWRTNCRKNLTISRTFSTNSRKKFTKYNRRRTPFKKPFLQWKRSTRS